MSSSREYTAESSNLLIRRKCKPASGGLCFQLSRFAYVRRVPLNLLFVRLSRGYRVAFASCCFFVTLFTVCSHSRQIIFKFLPSLLLVDSTEQQRPRRRGGYGTVSILCSVFAFAWVHWRLKHMAWKSTLSSSISFTLCPLLLSSVGWSRLVRALVRGNVIEKLLWTRQWSASGCPHVFRRDDNALHCVAIWLARCIPYSLISVVLLLVHLWANDRVTLRFDFVQSYQNQHCFVKSFGFLTRSVNYFCNPCTLNLPRIISAIRSLLNIKRNAKEATVPKNCLLLLWNESMEDIAHEDEKSETKNGTS